MIHESATDTPGFFRAAIQRLSVLVTIAAVLTVFSLGMAPPTAADVIVIDEGEDTSPYRFLPNLARYNRETSFAFVATDENGVRHDFETYVRFPVSPQDIPLGQVLEEALLVVTYAFDFTGFGETSMEPGVVSCHEVLAPWNQTTLTWSNRPAIDLPIDTITEIVDFGALICDVTPIVQGWLDGTIPNHGLAVTSPTSRVIGMHSFEADVNRFLMPNLFLTTVPEPGTAIGLASGFTLLATFAKRRRPL